MKLQSGVLSRASAAAASSGTTYGHHWLQASSQKEMGQNLSSPVIQNDRPLLETETLGEYTPSAVGDLEKPHFSTLFC